MQLRSEFSSSVFPRAIKRMRRRAQLEEMSCNLVSKSVTGFSRPGFLLGIEYSVPGYAQTLKP